MSEEITVITFVWNQMVSVGYFFLFIDDKFGLFVGTFFLLLFIYEKK